MALTSHSFIKSDTHITVCFDDGFQATIYATDDNYTAMCAAVREYNWEEARSLAEPAESVRLALEGVGAGRVRIDNGVVLVDEEELHNTLTDRMLDMLADGFDITPLMLFLENLTNNNSYRAVNELYDFLEASELPITEDGHFLAYKRIRDDYKDVYSGTMDNSIGSIVEMPRNKVDEDKHRTCSSGLHFCSRSYLRCYSGERIVVLKINPADVVAIPVDYNNAKGRTCRYEVIQELEAENPVKLERAFDDDSNTAEIIQWLGREINRFATPEDAEAATGIKASYIRRVLKGDRQSTGGFGWKYAVRTEEPKEEQKSALDGADEYEFNFRF